MTGSGATRGPATLPHIGQRVAYWRRRRGKSQYVLAGLAGISQPYLSQIESGHKPLDRLSTVVAIADALGVGVGELAGELGNGRSHGGRDATSSSG